MATAEEHAVVVLSAIIPNRRDLLDKALLKLTPAHFNEKVPNKIFSLLQRYAEVTGSVLTRSALEDLLRSKLTTSQVDLYLESYALYEETEVDDADFTWSVLQLRELAAERATGEAITDAMEILRQGKTDKSGELIKGHVEARTHLLEEFSEIDQELSMQEAPEGDMREERIDIMQDYADRKKALESGTSTGVLFGIRELDAKIGGLQNGELVLTAGYSSDGKTTLCTQLAWSAAIEQGLNVVFLTTETLRPQVRRKLISRHSKLELFGLPNGLNSRDLKAGTLSPTDEAKLSDVVNDFSKNPTYGKVYIAQVPRNATISSLEQRLYRYQRSFQVDVVVMDYLALLRSDRGRQTTREELAAIMKEAKQVSTTFDDGRGVPFVSPWQVSRAARENAEKIGQYTSASLSETAEATNSADVIVSLMAPTDNTDRFQEIQMQVLKNRDGETASGLLVDVDYATSHFASKIGVGALNSTNTSATGNVFGGTDYLTDY